MGKVVKACPMTNKQHQVDISMRFTELYHCQVILTDLAFRALNGTWNQKLEVNFFVRF